jgi:hypothetical protein
MIEVLREGIRDADIGRRTVAEHNGNEWLDILGFRFGFGFRLGCRFDNRFRRRRGFWLGFGFDDWR